MPRQDMEFIFRHTGVTGEDRMAQMKTMRPTTGFGETFQYSNFLVAAGGFAAARAFSREGSLESAYESAMRELVFKPMGMNDSVLRQEEALAGEAAMPHATDFEGGTSRIPLEIERSVHSVGPAGGVWSTVLDMAQYLLLELGTHDEGILERRNKGVKIDEHNSYGLGLFVSDAAGLRMIHHGGNTFGFSADMYFLPDKDLGVVALTNIYVANTFLAALQSRVFEMMFGAEPKSEKTVAAGVKVRQDGVELMRKKVTVNPDWGDLVGRYRCAELGAAEITKREQGLWMQFEEWGGPVGGEVEASGDRLLRLLSPPWRGTLKLLVDGNKLTLDGGQRKYDFLRV
jgi:CubicO group peptidase (beta-lactamase class C family)